MTEYRYGLRRETGLLGGCGPLGLFVMLNPSTADDMTNDPTIRRCLGFARSFGWRSFGVVNLFAARATDPADLWKHARPEGEGQLNDVSIEAAVEHADHVVAAWGASGGERARDRARVVVRNVARRFPLVAWSCLGTTRDGSPRHPLYVHGATVLRPWSLPEPRTPLPPASA